MKVPLVAVMLLPTKSPPLNRVEFTIFAKVPFAALRFVIVKPVAVRFTKLPLVKFASTPLKLVPLKSVA